MWHYVSSYETLCIECMTALPRPPSVNEVVTRQVFAAWVRRAVLQGVQTISLASAFLLLRRHREIQDERQQAVYENTAVIVMEIMLPGLLSHQPILIAMHAIQINGRITTNVKKINCNSFNIIIFFLVHPVFCILCLYGYQAKVGYLIFTNWCFRIIGSQGPILSSS